MNKFLCAALAIALTAIIVNPVSAQECGAPRQAAAKQVNDQPVVINQVAPPARAVNRVTEVQPAFAPTAFAYQAPMLNSGSLANFAIPRPMGSDCADCQKQVAAYVPKNVKVVDIARNDAPMLKVSQK